MSASSTSLVVDDLGYSIPSSPSKFQLFVKIIKFNLLIVVGFPYILFKCLVNYSKIKYIIVKAMKKPIVNEIYYQDKQLRKLVLNSKIGSLYRDILEYQLIEGYCASATTRNVCKSINRPCKLIEPKYSPSLPQKVATTIDNSFDNNKVKSYCILGNEGYAKFIEGLKLVNNVNYRVSINFLRSPLFGINWSLIPSTLIINLFGGHFSNILYYNEETQIVGVFDVNHKYSLWFCDAYRLYEAANTFDISSNKERGLIITEILN